MNIPSTCTTCNLPSDVTYKLQDAIHRPDGFSFDGAKELEITFRKILKINSSKQNQQSFVCQRCNNEFCRTYGVLHRFSQTENVFQRLNSITTPKRKVTVKGTVNPILDQKYSCKVVIEEESAGNASSLQSNDELKLFDIKQEFDEINNIAEIPLAIQKEELFIDDTVTESIPVTVQPPTFVPTTQQGNIVCPECAESFSSVFKLTFHRRKHYSGKFTCHQCNAIFKNYAQFRLHQNSHAGKSFDCSKCNAKFLYRRSLTYHLPHCIRKTGEIFACHECPSKFPNKVELKLHTAQRNFKCKICQGVFHSDVQLENHLQEVHSINKHHRMGYKCNDCDMIIDEKQSLYQHRLTHSKKSDLAVVSGRYDKFAKKIALKSRKPTHLKYYMCEQCGKGFTSLPILKSHQLLHTEPELKFARDQCDAKYYFRHSLKEHRAVHTMTVEFPCNKCDKNLPDMESLKRHELESHPNKYYEEKILSWEPYDCDQPSSKLPDKCALETHEKNIDSEKPFDCFKSDGNPDPQMLKLHQQLHTIDKNEEYSLTATDDPCPSQCFERERCGSKFENIEIFQRRKKNRRTGAYHCNKCLTNFRTIFHLKIHETAKHQHSCDRVRTQCTPIPISENQPADPRRFCSEIGIGVHSARTHDSKFRTWRHYNFHQKNSADSLRRCDKCSAFFYTDQSYDEHQRSEHGDENCRCNHCGVKFICRQNLLKHLKIVHRWDGDGTALSADVTEDDEECEVVYIEIVSDEE